MVPTVTEQQRMDIDQMVRAIAVGSIHVQAIRMEEREDLSERYLSVEVVLSAPSTSGGATDTWPADEFYQVRSRIRRAVMHEVDPEVDVQLTYLPADDPADVSSSRSTGEVGPGATDQGSINTTAKQADLPSSVR